MKRLISKGDGYWVLEGTEGQPGQTDGTAIQRDDTFQTECDDPHPVRISRERRAEWQGMSDWDKQQLSRTNWAEYWALQNGKRGWYCEGGEEHFYTQWTVRIDGEWTEEVCDSFAEARQVLEGYIGKVKLSRPAKPKQPSWQEQTQQVLDAAAVTYAPSGRRSWAACGHPAELDIDNHCYVCHEAVA